ncbi:MAG: 3-deoxy-7-phosphoheptulonate synthase [Bacteroidetes bacterium]|nr:MAG: 3-deoxy-7-phosphoheptulonate synthase [Bacteroidota bacterium]
MIIQLRDALSENILEQVHAEVRAIGYQVNEVSTNGGRYFVCVGKKEFDIRRIGNLPGVKDVHRVTDVNKLASRQWKVKDTVIDLGDGVQVGRGSLAVMAGPCSIESEEQVERTVEFLVANDVRIMRGGVFKPRSSPYSFRGIGIEGLKMFSRRCREHGIKIVTEVMQVAQVAEMYDYVDVFQVGARNSQNFNLLDELGKCGKPVLLKRGMSGTIEELLASAEYVFSNGNEKIMLCERGIRTYEREYRNTLDLNAVPILREKSHLPVIVDPSHGIGLREHVEPMALAAVMSGADGVIMEVHQFPEKAFSDGQQTLSFDEASGVFRKMRAAYNLLQQMN